MSSRWNVIQPTTLRLSKLNVPISPTTYARYSRPFCPTDSKCSQPERQRERHQARPARNPRTGSWWADPAAARPAPDEPLTEQVAPQHGRAGASSVAEPSWPGRRNASHPRARSRASAGAEPDEVPVDDREDGEQRADQVADQRGVEPAQAAAAHVDEHEQHGHQREAHDDAPAVEPEERGAGRSRARASSRRALGLVRSSHLRVGRTLCHALERRPGTTLCG